MQDVMSCRYIKASGEKLVHISVLSLDLGVDLDYTYASKLRGYIGNSFREYPILHHHVGELGYLYSYPKVQYKIIMGQPFIVGIDEGAKVVEEIAPRLKLIMMDKEFLVKSKSLTTISERVGPCGESKAYEFLTPWIALNEWNSEIYRAADFNGKQEILRRILVGNVLSLCKGINHSVGRRLRAAVFLRPTKVVYKALEFTAFTGMFLINYDLPTLAGIGKGVSHGFGTIKRIDQ